MKTESQNQFTLKNNIISIGKAQECFSSEGKFLKDQPFSRFKFLFLEVDGEQKLFLMIEGDLFHYHAEGLYHFMMKESPQEVKVNGGGTVRFQEPQILFMGSSGTFKTPNLEVFEKFAREIFPEQRIDLEGMDKSKEEENWRTHNLTSMEDEVSRI